MRERGLLPDFSAAVVAETGSIANAATASDSSLRDLRRLLWASIDNDDSLDLDQLSVAEQLPGGVVKIFVAVADVDAIVKKALLSMATRGPTPPRSIPPPKSFRCCRKSSRPTSRRRRLVIAMVPIDHLGLR
jgi:hypothetical protein